MSFVCWMNRWNKGHILRFAGGRVPETQWYGIGEAVDLIAAFHKGGKDPCPNLCKYLKYFYITLLWHMQAHALIIRKHVPASDLFFFLTADKTQRKFAQMLLWRTLSDQAAELSLAKPSFSLSFFRAHFQASACKSLAAATVENSRPATELLSMFTICLKSVLYLLVLLPFFKKSIAF